ncbi:M3 family metallopeptidase [Sphingomonas sp. KR3-1]|uniref:M3 family metallopeptidase n=1 Tax=Sphingomonas sp. KR3-1 TaxID=3156611 RepID=UPI0032B39BC0
MRKTALGIAFSAWIGCIGAATPPPADEVAVFLKGQDINPASAAAVDARCAAADALSKKLFKALEARSGPASIAGDYQRYDTLLNLIGDTTGQMYFISQTSTKAPVRDAGQKCSEQLSAISTDISLSRPVYDRLAAIPRAGLDAKTAFTLDKQLLSYRLAGVDRDAPTRAKIAQLNKDITTVGLEFDRNISEDKTGVTLPADALAGMPQDYIDAHKPGADGKIHLTTTYPDVFPIFKFADRPETRKAVYLAFVNRAHPVNDPVLAKLIAKRQELAQTLGFPDYATLITKDKMIGSPQRAQTFLDEINGAAMAAAKRDTDRLLARYRQIDPNATELHGWDTGYVSNLVKKEQYDVDASVVRQYFTLAKAQKGIFQLVHDLFGGDIRPWQGAPVWAPGVSAWELWDGKTLVGRFYLDLSPREGKYNHAAQFGIQAGVAGARIPVGALLCNFPATGPMDHGDVETFLHEFGHLIHSLYSGHQRFATQGMDQLQWDFIESPSQLLEEWVWDYDTLKAFASNDKGEPIPAALVAKMNAARHFGEAASWQRQLGFSAVSLGFYTKPAGFDLASNYLELYNRYSLVKEDPQAHMYAAFGHLNGYSAIYYTYTWSKAIALDLFTRFKAEGMRNPKTAIAYRRAVLDPGGSEPADQLIRNFLARDTNTKAFRDELGLSTAPVTAPVTAAK